MESSTFNVFPVIVDSSFAMVLSSVLTRPPAMMKEIMAKSGGSQQASTNNDQVFLLSQLMEQYATNFSTEPDNDVHSFI
jgi:hypothetical protein